MKLYKILIDFSWQHILCGSLERAIALTKRKHPDIEVIDSVHCEIPKWPVIIDRSAAADDEALKMYNVMLNSWQAQIVICGSLEQAVALTKQKHPTIKVIDSVRCVCADSDWPPIIDEPAQAVEPPPVVAKPQPKAARRTAGQDILTKA